MVSRSLSYALRLQGETDPSLPRVFGALSRELQSTQAEIGQVRERQMRLNRELRGVERGSEEYERLQGEIEEARRDMSRLTGQLDRQQESWGRLNRRSERFRNITLAGFAALGAGVGGLILQIDQLGESSAQILSISNATGLAVEEVERLQRVVGLVGQDLDIGDFNELSIRLGEIRQEAEKETPARGALEALGLTAREVSTRDLPLIIERLQQVGDVQRRAFLADEILGGTLAERLIPALDIPQEQLDRLNEVPAISREQREQFAAARVELEAFKQSFQLTGAAVGSAFLPRMTEALEAVQPLVLGFSRFASEHPNVLAALAAIAAGTVALTGIIWAANTARAVAAALTPGVGWAALGAAAIIGGGVFAAGAAALGQGQTALAEGFDTQERLTGGIRQAAYEGTREGGQETADALMRSQERTLENILPRFECLEERIEDRRELPPERRLPPPSSPATPEVPVEELYVDLPVRIIPESDIEGGRSDLERHFALSRQRRVQAVLDDIAANEAAVPTGEITSLERPLDERDLVALSRLDPNPGLRSELQERARRFDFAPSPWERPSDEGGGGDRGAQDRTRRPFEQLYRLDPADSAASPERTLDEQGTRLNGAGVPVAAAVPVDRPPDVVTPAEQRQRYGPDREVRPIQQGDTIIYQTNNIQTTDTAEEVLAEMRDAERRAGRGE